MTTPSVGILGFRNRVLPFFQAGNTIITKNGIFIYNGVPAFGNPPITWIVSAGITHDPKGNALPNAIVGTPGGIFDLDPSGTFAEIAKGNLILLAAQPSFYSNVGGIGVNGPTFDLMTIEPPAGAGRVAPIFFMNPAAGGSNNRNILAGTDRFVINPNTPGPLTQALLEVVPLVLANPALAIIQPADTNARLSIDPNGVLSWGPGNAAPDVDLKRGFAGALQTDSIFRVQNNALQIQAAASGNVAEQTFLAADTVARWQLDSNGKQQWGPGNAALDTDLARVISAGAPVLHTNNGLESASFNVPANVVGKHFGVDGNGLVYLADDTGANNERVIVFKNGDTNNRLQIDSNGRMDWGSGAAATDVSLLRSSAGTLEITQSLAILNSLQVLVNTVLGGTTVTQIDRTIGGSIETWHSLGALAVAGVTTVTGRYRLMADGDVEVDVLLSTAAAVATFSQAFPNILPAAYRPLANKICALGMTGASWTISASRFPNVLVDTAGDVQVNMPAIPGAVANIGCTFRYPTT